MFVYVCMVVCARARVCVCVCVCLSGYLSVWLSVCLSDLAVGDKILAQNSKYLDYTIWTIHWGLGYGIMAFCSETYICCLPGPELLGAV